MRFYLAIFSLVSNLSTLSYASSGVGNDLCSQIMSGVPIEDALLGSSTVTGLNPDSRRVSVPLYEVYGDTFKRNVYMGYEFMLSPPVFSEPEALREYINTSPKELRNAYFDGELVISVGRSELNKALERQPTKIEILEKIKSTMPSQFAAELTAYVVDVLADAQRRGYKFQTFTLAIRTEKIPDGTFSEGHNHNQRGDLNYARAEIGWNTEVDMLARSLPGINGTVPIKESDYVKIHERQSVVVFGDVWHRAPKNTGDPRLVILILLAP